MRALTGWVLCLLFVWAVAGCNTTETETCVPWAVQRCACEGGGESTRTCKENGSGWSPCVCGKAGSESDARANSKQQAQPKPIGAAAATKEDKFVEFNKSEFVITHGDVNIPAGQPGKLDIVMQGKWQKRGVVPVLVRNNTEKSARNIAVAGVVKSGDGAVIAMSDDELTYPPVVAPGELALAFIEFGSGAPADGVYEFKIKAGEQALRPSMFRPMKIEAYRGKARTLPSQSQFVITGEMKNPYKTPHSRALPSIRSVCFNDSGELTSAAESRGNRRDLAPGNKTSFQLTMAVDNCAAYMIAARGTFPKNSI